MGGQRWWGVGGDGEHVSMAEAGELWCWWMVAEASSAAKAAMSKGKLEAAGALAKESAYEPVPPAA